MAARDHGGNLDGARAAYGEGDWIDLSTGINRVPYPVPALSPQSWTDLPTKSATAGLCRVAANAYGAGGAVIPLAGAQAAIQFLPRILKPGAARVLGPTYNEHAASLAAAGWRVAQVATLAELAGADLAVVVNPNNPDGRVHDPAALLALKERVGVLIVDESFADPTPEMSLAGETHRAGLIVLRSFGKFYGLAGLRLGFVLGSAADIVPLAELAGPWPVSGAAIETGAAALADRAWQAETSARLRRDAARLDALMPSALVGGTALFRLYHTPDAAAVQASLARHHIWSRIFPYDRHWLRLGLPGTETEWMRLAAALETIRIPRPSAP